MTLISVRFFAFLLPLHSADYVPRPVCSLGPGPPSLSTPSRTSSWVPVNSPKPTSSRFSSIPTDLLPPTKTPPVRQCGMPPRAAEIVTTSNLRYADLLMLLLVAFVATSGKRWLSRHLRHAGVSIVERCGDRQPLLCRPIAGHGMPPPRPNLGGYQSSS